MQTSRILMIGAAVLLLTLFIFPLWQITLIAPQYPDGVVLKIWIDKIGGNEPGTLQNINILNHYVGMKPIEPESIPELSYLKYIVIVMATLGLLAAWINRKMVILGWAVLLLALGVLGMYDFYLWEYDYGHNLDPNAPIKIEGQAYQPPLIGQKTLLNFLAKSYPHLGGMAMFTSMILAFLAYWIKNKTKDYETANTSNAMPVADGMLAQAQAD